MTSRTAVEYTVYRLLHSSYSLHCERISVLLKGKACITVLFLPFKTAFCTSQCQSWFNLSAFLEHSLPCSCPQRGMQRLKNNRQAQWNLRVLSAVIPWRFSGTIKGDRKNIRLWTKLSKMGVVGGNLKFQIHGRLAWHA